MKLIMVRHGETRENRDNIMQGQIGGHLTKKGVMQAKKLGRRLKDEHFDIIYSSDLLRCKDTLREIRKYHPKTPVRYAKELRERKFGVWEGRTHDDVDNHLAKRGIRWNEWKPSGGEASDQMTKRVRRFLKRTLKERPDSSVLWVTHGGPIFKVLYRILCEPCDDKKKRQTFNTAVSIVELDTEGNHKLHLVNCVKHL
ncbi:histidine phosphatase family protein [Candidatus Woesearchaeota archaeon]|nr:histidine phosphatase family protein [Candidatus Woesearchaeota archaeon]